MSSEIPTNVNVPPEEIRQSIDKTVGYVLKNGLSFEQRLLANNTEHKFDFLTPENEYYNYYKWKIDGGNTTNSNNTTSNDLLKSQSTSEKAETMERPRKLKFLVDLPKISALDLDIIKLTALYVAKNGDEYAKKLQNHEIKVGNRAQFDFVNEKHSLNKLFRQYIDQYLILLKFYSNQPEDEDVLQINEQLNDADKMISNAYKRAQYDKMNKVERKEKQKLIEQKQAHFASIDWQDFAIVGMIEFDAIDEVKELPAPLSRENLLYRSLESKSKDLELPAPAPVSTAKTDEDKVKVATVSKPPAIKGMKIRAAGESRLKKSEVLTTSGVEPSIKCPITGKMIPELKFDNHLKVLLRDPRYKQEQENFVRKNFSYASNLTTDQVYENIKRIVRKRDSDSDQPQKKRPQIGPQ